MTSTTISKADAASKFAALLTSGNVADIATLDEHRKQRGTVSGVLAGLDTVRAAFNVADKDRHVATAVAVYVLRESTDKRTHFSAIAERMGMGEANVKSLAAAGAVIARVGVDGIEWGQLRTAIGAGGMKPLRKALAEIKEPAKIKAEVSKIVTATVRERQAKLRKTAADAKAEAARLAKAQAETQRSTPVESGDVIVTSAGETLPVPSGAATPPEVQGPSFAERGRLVRDAMRKLTTDELYQLSPAGLAAIVTDCRGLLARVQHAQQQQAAHKEAVKNGKAAKK